MKKIIAVFLCVLLLGCLAGCSGGGKTLADVKAAGKLMVVTSPDFPPFENLEGTEVVGIEMDLVKLICEKLNVEMDLEHNADFDAVLLGIQTGKFDMGAAGISIDPDREKNGLFSVPYCLAAQSIVVPEGSAIAGKADLTGKKVAVQTATTAEKACMAAGIQVSAYAANPDAQAALTSGKVEAWVVDDLTAAEMVAAYNEEHPEAKLVILDEALSTEPYAFYFSSGSQDLVDAVNEILNQFLADGTVAGLFEKYNAPYTSPDKG